MEDTLTVQISEGTLRGRRANTKAGKSYYSFQGIPYAKPPLGPLRFKVAQPPEPWSGVRDALKEGSPCTQFDMFLDTFHGAEDSLYINVYSPKLPSSESEKLQLPVMVWIHGGGFISGSGGTDFYGPDYLVDEGVVLVTFNYRLGILGFLSLDDPVAPGNVGLKDQVTALRWVQRNIANFGGDPNNVTIFGESAGGVSVNFHMLSPMSQGLFNRAIAQSGASISTWAVQSKPRDVAFRTAKALGFQGHNEEDLLQFLRAIDDMTLVKAAMEHASSAGEKEEIIQITFQPVVEIEVEGVERFLPAHPMVLLEEGQYHAVPYMTGVTDQEGLFSLIAMDIRKPEIASHIEKHFDKIILSQLRLPKKCRKELEIISQIRHFYFKDKALSTDNLDGYFDLFTDIWFAEPMHHTLKKMAQFDKAPVYNYLFSYDGITNFCKLLKKIDKPGACHADELGYLFRAPICDLTLPDGSTDEKVRIYMVKLWTNFAKMGNPTPGGDQLPVIWSPYTALSPSYLEINEVLTVKKHLFKKRMEFWEQLYRDL